MFLKITSHFRFPDPPTDLNRWKIAQGQAATGEQVLLKKILESFPFFMDFLDGDIQFRLLHNLADVFVDGFGKNDLSPLVGYNLLSELPMHDKYSLHELFNAYSKLFAPSNYSYIHTVHSYIHA